MRRFCKTDATEDKTWFKKGGLHSQLASIGLPDLPGLVFKKHGRKAVGLFSVFSHAREGTVGKLLSPSWCTSAPQALRIQVSNIRTVVEARLINDYLVRLFSPLHSYGGIPVMYVSKAWAKYLCSLSDEAVVKSVPANHRRAIRNAYHQRYGRWIEIPEDKKKSASTAGRPEDDNQPTPNTRGS